MADAVKSDAVKGKLPENVTHPPLPPRRVASSGASTFKVRTRGVLRFIRCGIPFGPDPITVDGASLTEDQKNELLNTPTLDVDDGSGSHDATTASAPTEHSTSTHGSATHHTHEAAPEPPPKTSRR